MSMEEPRQLNDEQLEQVSGGYIHIFFGGEHAGEWEVIYNKRCLVDNEQKVA